MRINRHVLPQLTLTLALTLLVGVISPVQSAMADNPSGPAITFNNVKANGDALPSYVTLDFYTPQGAYSRDIEMLSRPNGSIGMQQLDDGEYYFTFDAADWQHFVKRTIYVHVVA